MKTMSQWLRAKLFKYDLLQWSDYVFMAFSSLHGAYNLAGNIFHLAMIVKTLENYQLPLPTALITDSAGANDSESPKLPCSIPVFSVGDIPKDGAPSTIVIAGESVAENDYYRQILTSSSPIANARFVDLYAEVHPCPIGTISRIRKMANPYLQLDTTRQKLDTTRQKLDTARQKLDTTRQKLDTTRQLFSEIVRQSWRTLMLNNKEKYGGKRVAFYGAGFHSQWLLEQVLPVELWPARIYDDCVRAVPITIPVMSTDRISLKDTAVIVVSSDTHHFTMTQALHNRSETAGIAIVDPYESLGTTTFDVPKEP